MAAAQPLESDSWAKSPAKKDTRRWCKGKVGREHVREIREHRYLPALKRDPQCGPWIASDGWVIQEWHCHHEVYCTVCGKVFWYDQFECPDRPRGA